MLPAINFVNRSLVSVGPYHFPLHFNVCLPGLDKKGRCERIKAMIAKFRVKRQSKVDVFLWQGPLHNWCWR